MGGPALAELGRDIEEHAAGSESLRIESACVEDGLPGRARLARPISGRVVFGLELRAGEVLAVIACAADVGQDVAGAVVERDERRVMEVLATERVDPRSVAGPDPQASEQVRRCPRLEVRCDHGCREPFLRELLGPPVERRDHRVAASLDRGIRSQDRLELAADLPGEMRGLV